MNILDFSQCMNYDYMHESNNYFNELGIKFVSFCTRYTLEY
jgi:hypothetical protein